MEMTADLREKDLHILKGTSMKQQENPADFSSVHKVLDFFAQICCHFPPCISYFTNPSNFFLNIVRKSDFNNLIIQIFLDTDTINSI